MTAYPSPGVRRGPGIARPLALAGIVVSALGVLTFLVLHIVPPTSAISPVHRTISEYGLTSLAWVFDIGVIGLAAGSALIFTAHLTGRREPEGTSRAAVAAAGLWVAGLLVLVAFPKHNWALGYSPGGSVHRFASLVAFLALPAAVLVIQRRRAGTGWGLPRWGCLLAVGGLAWFVPILLAMVTAAVRAEAGLPWWQAIPLGLIERGLAGTEVAALLTLGVDAARRAQESPAPMVTRERTVGSRFR